MRRIVIVLWLASTGAAAAEMAGGSQEPARLTVALDATEGLTVGDRVTAELVLTWAGPEPAAPPRFPTWGENWGSAEVLTVGEVIQEAMTVPGQRSSSTQPRPRTYRQTVVLTAFRTGRIELPPVIVAMPLAARTREVRSVAAAFEVGSVLPEDAAVPRPPAPPQVRPADARFPVAAALLAGLCVLAAVTLRRRLAAERPPIEAPRSRPLEELVDLLAGLDPGAGSEPVHTRLSLALRRFLGRTLDIPARESTTREIQRRLRRAAVPPDLARRTVDLLGDCDQVKFARREVAPAVTGGRLAATFDLAREIDGRLGSAR